MSVTGLFAELFHFCIYLLIFFQVVQFQGQRLLELTPGISVEGTVSYCNVFRRKHVLLDIYKVVSFNHNLEIFFINVSAVISCFC